MSCKVVPRLLTIILAYERFQRQFKIPSFLNVSLRLTACKSKICLSCCSHVPVKIHIGPQQRHLRKLWRLVQLSFSTIIMVSALLRLKMVVRTCSFTSQPLLLGALFRTDKKSAMIWDRTAKLASPRLKTLAFFKLKQVPRLG